MVTRNIGDDEVAIIVEDLVEELVQASSEDVLELVLAVNVQGK
jgi:hypothetical protein